MSSYRSKYSTTGPVSRIQFDGVDALNALLRDETLVRMARKLAVGLLRKGGGIRPIQRPHAASAAACVRSDNAEPLLRLPTSV